MTTLTNSFEGGTNGTTITAANSGGASGNALDVVNIGSGDTVAFSNAHAAHGSLSCQMSTGSTNPCTLVWSTSMGSQSQVWFRIYLYFTAFPSGNFGLFRLQQTASFCGDIFMLTSGLIRAQNSAFGTVFNTAGTIPLNQWFRIEGFIIGSASVGQISLQVYDTAGSATPTESITSAATQNTFGAPNTFLYGVSAPSTAISSFWMDDIGLSSTGPLGPVKTLKTGTSIVPSLVAAGVI